MKVAEFVIVDEGATFDASHPMHLHGHSFRVVSQRKVGKMTTVKEIQEMDMAGTSVLKENGNGFSYKEFYSCEMFQFVRIQIIYDCINRVKISTVKIDCMFSLTITHECSIP